MELKRHRMTEHIFKAIKLMLKGGATAEEINEHYPVSKETLRRIRRSETYADYVEMQRVYSERSAANRRKKEEQQEEPEQLPNQISIDDLKQDSETVELLKEQNDLLRRLMNDVAFLVSELTGKAGCERERA